MIDSEWFPLHRRKGYEDDLIQPSPKAMFISGRKVPTFRKDAASRRASDTARSDFSVSIDGPLASKAQQINH